MLIPDPNLTLIDYGVFVAGWAVISLFLTGVSFLLWAAFRGIER